MENAGKKIYDLRKKRGLSQDQLAKKIGVSRQTIYKWESDLASPSFENVESLCAALGVDVEYFYGSDPVKEETATPKAKGGKLFLILSIVNAFISLIALFAAVILYFTTRVTNPGDLVESTNTVDRSVFVATAVITALLFLAEGVFVFLTVKKNKPNANKM